MKILRLDVLIAEKALRDGVSSSKVLAELASHLQMTTANVSALRRTTNAGRVKAEHIIGIAIYFNVSVDDVINPAFREAVKASAAS